MPSKSKEASLPRSRAAASRTRGRSSRGDAARREGIEALHQAVEAAAVRLQGERKLRAGTIVFRAAEGESPAFTLCSTDAGIQIREDEQIEPLLEVIGDPRRVSAIVRGEKDARMQFFAGGIRVRGDMHYLSELGLELGFLKKPIV